MCKKKELLTVMLFFAALLLCGCASKEPKASDVKAVVMSIMESESNPLNNSYVNINYELENKHASEENYKYVYSISEDSELSHVEMEAVLYFGLVDGEWETQGATSEITKIYPFSPPDNKFVEDAMLSQYSVEEPYLDWMLSVRNRSWDSESPEITDTIDVSFIRTCDIYKQTINARLTAKWNEYEEKWELGTKSSDYSVISTEYDFSRLNGRWEGTWTNTIERIPLWFEITDAGTVTISKDNSTDSWTTVNLEHNLNEVLNNNTTSIFYSQYTTGSVQLSVEGSAEEPNIYIKIPYPGDPNPLSDTTIDIEKNIIAYTDIFRTNLNCVSEREAWSALDATAVESEAPATEEEEPKEEIKDADTDAAVESEQEITEDERIIQMRFSKTTALIICAIFSVFVIITAVILILRRKRKIEPDSKTAEMHRSEPMPSKAGIWICPRCEAKNSGQYCSNCGFRRSDTPYVKHETSTDAFYNRADSTAPTTPEFSESCLKKGRWESSSSVKKADDLTYFRVPIDF